MAKSKRKIDENGYMTIEGCPISSYGIFQYSAGQLGLPGDPMRIVNVYRPESAVSDPEYIESLKNLPLIDEHEMLSGFDGDDDGVAPEDKGVEGIITANAYYEAPWARGDIRIYSRNMQHQLERGKEDLSLGYSCRYTEQPGIWNGTPYEVVQDKMRGNHIALVKEGRVPGARVLDGLCFDHLSFDFRPSDEGNEMGLKKAKQKTPVQRAGQAADSAVEELRALWPKLSASVQKFLGEEAQEPEHQEGAAAPAEPTDSEHMTEHPTLEGAQEDDEEHEEAPSVADPAVAAVDPEHQEGAASEMSGEGEVAELISQVKAILARLEGTVAEEADEENGEGQDVVEGLEEQSSLSGAQTASDDGGEGKDNSEELPEMAQKNAQDAAIRGLYRDIAAKDRLYKRLSSVVGAFDHRAMDSAEVAVYGVKKLAISCEKGQEVLALDMYLKGVEAARGAASRQSKAQDSASSAPQCAELDSYLKGE